MTQPKPAIPPIPPPAPTGQWAGGEDAAIVRACLAGDALAWEELVTRYKALVYSIPRAYGLDPASSDDVFQEVYAILLRQLPGLRNPEGLPKWLITTTHRTCRQLRRKSRRRAGDPDPVETGDPPEEQAMRWERQQVVRESLRRLGGRCEELLVALHGGPGPMSYEAVARRLDMPLGSVGPTRARCIERLMEILESVDRDRVLPPAD